MAENEKEEPAASGGLEAAGARIRETAKWMAVTFGAVAGVLVGGLQLTSLKDVTGSSRSDALVGYALAVGGTLVVILAAAVTLTAGRRTLHDLAGTGGKHSLRKKLNEMEDLRAGWQSIAALVDEANAAISARTAAWKAWRQNETPQTEAAYKAAIERFSTMKPALDRLTEIASFEHIRRTWAWCRAFVVLGAIAAAVGVAIFAANVGGKPEAEPAKALEPVVVTAELTPDGLAAHRAELGDNCTGPKIAGVLTDATDKAWTLLVVPTDNQACGPASIVVQRSEGSLRRVDSVPISP